MKIQQNAHAYIYLTDIEFTLTYPTIKEVDEIDFEVRSKLEKHSEYGMFVTADTMFNSKETAIEVSIVKSRDIEVYENKDKSDIIFENEVFTKEDFEKELKEIFDTIGLDYKIDIDDCDTREDIERYYDVYTDEYDLCDLENIEDELPFN